MARSRSTIPAASLIDLANARIEHLASQGTKEAADKRRAIIDLTMDTLIEARAYKGFRYLEEPVKPMPGQIGLQYDNSRISFFGGTRPRVTA